MEILKCRDKYKSTERESECGWICVNGLDVESRRCSRIYTLNYYEGDGTIIELEMKYVEHPTCVSGFSHPWVALGLSKNSNPIAMNGLSLFDHRYGPLAHDKELVSAGPLLPVWVLYPIVISLDQHGIVCVLLFVEALYLAGWMSYEVYNHWMMLNSGSYQLGSNPALLKLWDERLNVCVNVNAADVDEALKLGCRVANRVLRSRKKQEIAEQTLDDIRKGPSVGIRFRKCVNGGVHISLEGAKLTSRNRLRVLNQLYPWTEYEDRQKTNLDLASLVFYAIRNGQVSKVNEALGTVPIGMTNTVATGLVIAALGNSEWHLIHKLVFEDRKCCLTIQSWKDYFKAISVATRRTSRWHNGIMLNVEQVAAIAYFELLIGRAANLTDWADERSKRVGPELPLKNPYTGGNLLDDMEDHLRGIVRKLMPARDSWGTWEDFVYSRQRWAPSGSAGGARKVIEGEAVRLNKHSFFEELPTSEMLAWIDKPPELRARGSEKLESGKSRAIYGTDPIDQSLVTYLITPLERMMGRVPGLISGHLGAQEVADIGKRLAVVCDGAVECTMIDFADFNYQHTLEAQYMLYRIIMEEVSLFGNEDLTKVARWVMDAQLSQYVKFPADAVWYKVTQGMFSGVRSTDFTNTILNLAYFETIRSLVARHFRLHPIQLYNLHKGDDVWISNKSRVWAMEMYRAMGQAGFVFQSGKQMFDIGRGEFLRVLYTPEGARGYVMRAVASLLIKPIQSVTELAPQSKATAYTSQVHLLYRRGLDVEACRILWWALIPHALKMKTMGNSGVGIPVSVAMKSFLDGGLDLGAPMTMATPSVSTKPLPAPVPHTDELAGAIKSNMSHDWIITVSKALQSPFDAPKLESLLHHANVSDSLRPIDRQRTMRRLEKDLKLWRDQVASVPHALEGGRCPLVLSEGGMASAKVMGERLMYSLKCLLEVEMEPGKPLNIVDTLIAGIAASPLRDLSSAKAALGVSTLEAARECLQLASDKVIARKAALWLNSLVIALGEEITVCILDGIRGVGVSFEALLHPVILSLISKRATDYAILCSWRHAALIRGMSEYPPRFRLVGIRLERDKNGMNG
uniref:RNA-directed RNA polymerase n=1 Tax=Atrato virus TaxID=2689336 RepID=A0A6B9KGL7_9VIRU|nr:RdRp [Atrato virus]